MSDHPMDEGPQQQDLFETEAARSLLDQLLTDSRLYKTSKDYKDLLDFVVRLRNFAPFNAMLLQLQKPGLKFAASALDWYQRFERKPKESARPLLILWPFGPVALVYDEMDTEGKPLPEDVSSFFAHGPIDKAQIASLVAMTTREKIEWFEVDEGDQNAGSIRVVKRAVDGKGPTQYRMHINRNHPPVVQFATLTHELGHLFLGHLGADKHLNIPQRISLSLVQRELEAEFVAYVVCGHNDVKPKSQTYLANFVTPDTKIEDIDIYQVMRAAGKVEALLGLTGTVTFDRPRAKTSKGSGN